MKRAVLWALIAIVIASCSSGADTSTTTTAATTTGPEVSTTAVPAVAVVARFYAAGETWPTLVRADALLRFEDGTVPLAEHIADEAIADWDGDSVITNADYISRTATSRRVFQTVLDAECLPSGSGLLCTVGQTDLLYRRAGIVGPAFRQTFEVNEGLITELSLPAVQVGSEADAAEDAWAAHLAAFEQWLASNRPAEYRDLFVGPCCGSPLNFTPDTAPRLESSLAEWIASE